MTSHPRDPGLLMDRAAIMRELGVKRGAAERIMLDLPKVEFPNLAKVYVRRSDVFRLVDESTRAA